jgi:pimeloyl-ACP methyl ester carboxylesterase
MNKYKWFVAGLIAGLLSLLSALIYRLFRKEMHVARGRLRSGGRLIDTASGPVEYAEHGQGFPILVVHGIGGGYDQSLLTASIIENGFRLVAPSRFGYLRTPLPEDASLTAQTDAHAALLDALGIQRAAVVGVSAGGPSSLLFALRYPERCAALLLVSAVSRPINLPKSQLNSSANTFLKGDFMTWLTIKASRLNLPTLHRLLGSGGAQIPPQEEVWLDAFLDTTMPTSMRLPGIVNDIHILSEFEPIRFEDVTAPTFIIHAVNDTLVPQGRYTAGKIPQAEYLELPDGNHLLLGHHQEVGVAAVEFLHRHLLEPQD